MSYGTPPFYFDHRQPSKKISESPLKRFMLMCGACRSEHIKGISDTDEDNGEFVVYLVCQKCGQREKFPVS